MRGRASGQATSGAPDGGLFGPDSVSWRVLAERSVVMGGMRALVMHACHPLVAAAGRQTGMYEHDPWGRLERTLRLTFTVIFGSTAEATAAARQINRAHRLARGTDGMTGQPYSARDPELLLWVHASLISSFLLYERLTVGRLDTEGRQRFHREATVMAGLLGLPEHLIPPTVADLETYIAGMCDRGELRMTDQSRAVLGLMGKANGISAVKSQLARLLALHTLPVPIRELHGIGHSRADQRAAAVLCSLIRTGRPLIPRARRQIGPAIAARARMSGADVRICDAPVLPARFTQGTP